LLATVRVIQADSADLSALANAFRGEMVSYRNEVASYVSLRELLLSRMHADGAERDRVMLGELLLDKDVRAVPSSEDEAIAEKTKRRRLLAALIVRVGERDLLNEALQLVAQWTADLDTQRQKEELAEMETALR
jgi:hypothetical protein